jgi:hypothetical protein
MYGCKPLHCALAGGAAGSRERLHTFRLFGPSTPGGMLEITTAGGECDVSRLVVIYKRNPVTMPTAVTVFTRMFSSAFTHHHNPPTLQ